MKRLLVSIVAVGLMMVEAGSASAAWNNVFQTTLFGRWRRQTTVYYVAPPVVTYASPAACCTPCPPPQPVCSTSYVQRCYYQPVTTHQTQTYYEPVTTYRTSYYYEPVTSYRYSCYYDPCTCSYQQVATPTTSYQLRAQSCPVQSWVQRCASVPVTTYQKSCYLEPQTVCCTPGAPVVAAPPVMGTVPQPPPQVEQRSTPPPPVINENRDGTGSPLFDKKYYPPNNGTSWQPQGNPPIWQPSGSVPPAVRPIAPSPPPPPVKLDRIVFGPDSAVEGQIMRSDNSPRPNAKLLFVNANNGADRQRVTANTAGRFHVTLATGGWLVYVDNPDGTQTFNSRIEVTPQPQHARIQLVSR